MKDQHNPPFLFSLPFTSFLSTMKILVFFFTLLPISLAKFVGYLATLSDESNDSVYQLLSKGNDPYTFRQMTKSKTFIPNSNIGTGGARDPELVVSHDRKDFWLLATDLASKKVSLQEAISQGSKSIYIWHSNDLVNWSKEPKLIQIENSQAGMVWTPSAMWNEDRKEYFVFWSTILYSNNDLDHQNKPLTPKVIRFATTKDFQSFSKPKTYLQSFQGHDLLHQTIIPFGSSTQNNFIRFVQDQTEQKVYCEISNKGLFSSNWNRFDLFVDDQPREAPLVFKDNLIQTKYHLWLDDATGSSGRIGYRAYTTNNIDKGKFGQTDGTLSPWGMRNGNVIRLTEPEYKRLQKLL